MAVTLRLVRLGRRNKAFFRLRASHQRNRTKGAFLEELGFVDPLMKDPAKQATLKKDRIEHWLSQGAKVTSTVDALLKKHGIAAPKTAAAR